MHDEDGLASANPQPGYLLDRAQSVWSERVEAQKTLCRATVMLAHVALWSLIPRPKISISSHWKSLWKMSMVTQSFTGGENNIWIQRDENRESFSTKIQRSGEGSYHVYI